MITFTKTDLFYQDYEWSLIPNFDDRVSGRLDETRFNKMQGNEVLYLINKLADLWDLERKESCIKIERCIREKLPPKINKQEDVATWIQLNWRKIEVLK
ncbi:hypothetical protein [Flavobacterium sp.]|uniref:hypothetical protein n=1 Tax=Flavobacterium sp. TaxID=239 RepID=UPI002609CE4A|nr:hypothetical protein [Flavobacterium sp.]